MADMPDPSPHDIVHLLVNIATHQLTITQDIREVLHELRGFNQQQVAINERLEQMLRGLLPPSPNGH